jgi:outer membrane protein assembly factor BamD (BamD/ComL family)
MRKERMNRQPHSIAKGNPESMKRLGRSLACVLPFLVIPVSGARFEEQRAAVSSSVETQPEKAIISLLKAGIEENRPAQALAVTRTWLRQNLPEDAMLLRYAGRAAELSGDWKDAAALYQQSLRKADPKSAEAGDSITAVYTLLINQLNDTAGAYAFGLNEAPNLAINPRFRQFDRWFLDAAMERKDHEAVAIRLLATIRAGVPNDQLIALYDGDFRWLLESARGLQYDAKKGNKKPKTNSKRKPMELSTDFYSVGKELAEAIDFDEELKLALNWTVSAKIYNFAMRDDEKMDPPIAEAKALLERYPQYAAQVQDDWAGGRADHPEKPWQKYWADQLEAKLAPVRTAEGKLTPLERADFLKTWTPNYYFQRVPVPLTADQLGAYLQANLQALNSKSAPLLTAKAWNSLSVAEAGELAPLLERNPSPEASLIRAVAAAGEDKNFDKAMDALLGTEVWRLGIAELDGRYADQLWHWAGRPGDSAKRDQEIARSKAVAGKIPKDEIAAKAPVAQRMAAFKELWDDFRSGQPKIPGVLSRLPKVLRVTPQAVPGLLRDQSPEAQMLVRDVIERGMEGPDGPLSGEPAVLGLSPYRYDPSILRKATRHRSMDYVKTRVPDSYRAHPLEPELRKVVADFLKQNKAEPWLTMAWINAQFMEDNAESVKVMEELFKSPVFKTLPFEVRYGARAWFRDKAMTPAQFAYIEASDPKLLSMDLVGLAKEADVTTTIAALGKALEGARKSPVRIEIHGLDQLAAVSDEVFSDAKVQGLILELADSIRSFEPTQDFGNRLLKLVGEQRDPGALLRTAAYIWRHVQISQRPLPTVMALTESLVEDQPSAASAFALCGLATIDRHVSGNTWFKRETDIPQLKSIRGKAAMKLGLIVIPVAPNHPSYPLYQSQAEWMSGNEDKAWSMLSENWDAFVTMHRELSVSYLMWALQRVIYSRNDERQEVLVKSLLGWASEVGSPLTLTEKANVEIAYGDIALQRGQLRQAHEIYSRTQSNEAYKDLAIRHQATLRRARAERIAKNFDAALQTLGELELERVPELWETIRYARAEVNFDMEEYEDAKDDIDSILSREPNHADARILLGKVQLKRQKLMEATEVELGSATGQKSLVPGEKLKVTLSDPTLEVSGAGTEIEVIVWATSGDKESFFLRQFGDQKTKFRGEVATALGAPQPNDDILQVIGDDEVFYAYSDRFREKMNNIEEKRGGPIVVASDAILMASARKLLTEAEQRTADMEAVMDEIKNKVQGNLEEAAKAKMAARSMDAAARTEDKGLSETELGRYIVNVVKPGNPIHVRVIDSDRSRTAGIDELIVSASSTSGDSISRVTLKETGTHTGWFEGSIPTTGAQAMAMAQNSEPGRNPNMVISPVDYPAWRPVANKGVTPEFTDNVGIGEMTITAGEAGAKLNTFVLQTGMNGSDMTTVAAYPKNQISAKLPWNPSVTVMNDTDRYHAAGGRSVDDLPELVEQLDRGWMSQQFAQGFATNVAGPSDALPGQVLEAVKWKRQNRSDVSAVIYRFKGVFYEKSDVTRRFRLDLGNFQIPKDTHPSINHPPQFLLAVDGRPITEKDGKLEGAVELRAGVHKFEIWATGWVNNIGFGKRPMKLQANLDGPETLSDCPDGFFDPATFPVGVLDHRNSPATVEGNGDGTVFKVKFAEGSQARMFRLIMIGHEGAVPALNKIALTQPDGKAVLPVVEDFAALNKNDTLEILTGDRISVRYLDDRFVTKSKERHERSLNVSFTDARAEFADMEPRWSGRHGKDMPYYEKLLRFRYDEPLSLAIHDADMDVSVQPDAVKVSIETANGGRREFDATETGDSTGIFRLVITPVAGSADGGNKIQVAEGGTITARYLDKENNRPGVPTERVGTIRHAAFLQPEFRLSNAVVTPIEGEGMAALHHGFDVLNDHNPYKKEIARESVRPRWQIESTMIRDTEAPEGGIDMVLGQRASIELIAPQFALGTASKVSVYAQTDAGRRKAGLDVSGEGSSNSFDLSVPGTIELDGGLYPPVGGADQWRMIPSLAIYQGGSVSGLSANPDLDRFNLTVPLVAGILPPYGALTAEERKDLAKEAETSRDASATMLLRPNGLVTQPGDRIHFGFRYTDKDGKEKWLTASSKVITHPVFDIMTEDYRSAMTSAYVGETLNLRIVDLGADVSDAIDSVNVLMQAKSGAKYEVQLLESGPHTGIFKAGYALAYVKDGKAPEPAADGTEPAAYDVRREGFPVIYGDTVAARYTDGNGVKTNTAMVTISKGADGTIEPFSKKYDDPEIAMRTQFSLAEAYLEIAKRHRKLNEPEAAALEYESAKQLLSKAMDQFTDPDTRAHAEYLLGTLTMEEADATEDPEMQETRYRAALSRFLNVTGSYSQTLHASKAQYKIATLYEKLKEPDIAAQEYVKLAYKYPDSEFLATSMARLGSHFLKKAAEYEAQAKPLLAKAEADEDKDAKFEGEAMQKMAVGEYLKTAQIFSRMQERFPGNELAGDAGLRAGQAYMRAGKTPEAVDAFKRVIAEQGYDSPKIRAQAMYWTGMCYQTLRQEMAAYSIFKRLTYDFPESEWAAFARGQLSQEKLLNLENKLELERLEDGQ